MYIQRHLKTQQKECRMFKKIMPYNLRKLSLLAMLAAMPAFTACEKDDEDVKPQHDTTYTFSPTDFSNVSPTTKIEASADSSQVRNVILEVTAGSMGLSAWDGAPMSFFINNKLKPAFAASPKVKGKGNFKNANTMLSQADSLWLVQQGFTVNQNTK